jgi:hypothetical protein
MSAGAGPGDSSASSTPLLVLAWAFVGIPLVWGVWVTLGNAMKLFS